MADASAALASAALTRCHHLRRPSHRCSREMGGVGGGGDMGREEWEEEGDRNREEWVWGGEGDGI
uniref:Uncharacterized protein n=1 Tax=Oryza meridionalis TaxID=40149 RepID=A0A0E0C1D6_9ORYZ